MINLIKILLIFIFTTYHFTLKADEIEKVIFSIDTLSYIIDDLDVDILALQEITSTEALSNLASNLGNNWMYYRSEDSSDYGTLSYLVNTDEITINSVYTILYGSEYYFAYRLPYILDFDYNNQN